MLCLVNGRLPAHPMARWRRSGGGSQVHSARALGPAYTLPARCSHTSGAYSSWSMPCDIPMLA